MIRAILVVFLLAGGVAVAAPANKPAASATMKKSHHHAKAHKVARVKKARKHLAKPHRSHKK